MHCTDNSGMILCGLWRHLESTIINSALFNTPVMVPIMCGVREEDKRVGSHTARG